MSYRYYRREYKPGDPHALVRLQGNRVEHYDGKEIWNGNWVGAGQAYMDITGMGGGWYLYFEVEIETVEDIKRKMDALYKKEKVYAYQKDDRLAGY